VIKEIEGKLIKHVNKIYTKTILHAKKLDITNEDMRKKKHNPTILLISTIKIPQALC
jgi:hypothetical protein